MARLAPSRPLIVVLGATGTGKSKLAVEIASHYNGEVINADAIQMYRGLPIVTNKIAEAEKNGIRHHLLDQIGLDENPWTVHEFVSESSRIIDEIRARGKLPVVVGGTTYYIYSLLFPDAILAGSGGADGDGKADDDGEGRQGLFTADRLATVVKKGEDECDATRFAILDSSTEVIYAKLQEVDPAMAARWHPNDRRKIQRSLEIWLRSGRKASEVYAEQHASKETKNVEDGNLRLRYDPLLFWLDAEDQALKKRLDARVDVMVHQGLLEEVTLMRELDRKNEQRCLDVDKSKGIWVAIGYKQLTPWLEALEEVSGSLENQQKHAHLKKEGIEMVKSATKQYARRQIRWIRNRLADALVNADLLQKLFLLDASDVEQWDRRVTQPCFEIIQKFLAGQKLPDNASLSFLAGNTFRELASRVKVERQTMFCETCQKTLMSEQGWDEHLKSQSHKKVLAGQRKRALRDAYLASKQNVG